MTELQRVKLERYLADVEPVVEIIDNFALHGQCSHECFGFLGRKVSEITRDAISLLGDIPA